MNAHARLGLAGALIVCLLIPSPVTAAPDRAHRSGGTEPRASVVRVKIVDDRFRPRSITVAKGTRVRWVNRGNHTHTTTSDDGIWDSGLLSSGAAFSRRFGKRGTFDYHCTVHPSMTGTIVVT